VARVKKQYAITQGPASLVNVAKGLRTHNAIDWDAAMLLKRPDTIC
jgi:hypothetical protein